MVSVSGVEGKKISVRSTGERAPELDPPAAGVGPIDRRVEPVAVQPGVKLPRGAGRQVENEFRATRPTSNEGVAAHR
jgi:hypothetical protein